MSNYMQHKMNVVAISMFGSGESPCSFLSPCFLHFTTASCQVRQSAPSWNAITLGKLPFSRIPIFSSLLLFHPLSILPIYARSVDLSAPHFFSTSYPLPPRWR